MVAVVLASSLSAAAVNVTWASCEGFRSSIEFDPSRWADQRLRPSLQLPDRLHLEARRVPELGALRSLAQQLSQAVREAPQPQSVLSRARTRAGRYAQRLAQRRKSARPQLLRQAGGFREHDLGMSVSEAVGAREQMCRRHIVHDIGNGISDQLTTTMSTHFFGSIGGALCKMMVKPIGAVFALLLLLIFIAFVAKDFINKIGTYEDKILPTAITMMMPQIVVSYLAQALSRSLSVSLAESLYVALLTALDMSIMSQIVVAFTVSSNPMLHHKILHQTVGGVVRDTQRVLSLRLVQIIAHSVTHTVTHSIIHHYYCIYCYFHGEFCNYCYYYGEYQWLHNLFDEKSAGAGTTDQNTAGIPP